MLAGGEILFGAGVGGAVVVAVELFPRLQIVTREERLKRNLNDDVVCFPARGAILFDLAFEPLSHANVELLSHIC